MSRLVVLESMWNPKGKLLNEEPSVLPYLKAIRQSLAWEGIRINLVYRRFYSHYDLGLLLKEMRRHRKPQVCYISSHGEHRKLTGLGDKVMQNIMWAYDVDADRQLELGREQLWVLADHVGRAHLTAGLFVSTRQVDQRAAQAAADGPHQVAGAGAVAASAAGTRGAGGAELGADVQ